MFAGSVSELPHKPSIIAVRESESFAEALKTLVSSSILSAPIITDGGNFLGQVDLLDAVVFLVYFSKKTQELLVALGLLPEHKTVDFSGVFREKAENLDALFKVYQNAASLANFSSVNPTRSTPAGSTLNELAKLLSVNHRVAILAADGTLDNYITQSDFMKHVSPSITHASLKRPISDFPSLGSSNIISVPDYDAVIEGLREIVLHRISSVAVVDGEGNFVNELCPRDIREINLEAEFLDNLIMPLKEYFATVLHKGAVPTLNTNSTVQQVLATLVERRLHRVFVLDAGKPVRVISLGDFLRFLQEEH